MTSSDKQLPAGLRQGFWHLVVLLNVGPISLTVGTMLLLLGEVTELAVVALGVGLTAMARAGQVYRKCKKRYAI